MPTAQQILRASFNITNQWGMTGGSYVNIDNDVTYPSTGGQSDYNMADGKLASDNNEIEVYEFDPADFDPTHHITKITKVTVYALGQTTSASYYPEWSWSWNNGASYTGETNCTSFGVSGTAGNGAWQVYTFSSLSYSKSDVSGWRYRIRADVNDGVGEFNWIYVLYILVDYEYIVLPSTKTEITDLKRFTLTHSTRGIPSVKGEFEEDKPSGGIANDAVLRLEGLYTTGESEFYPASFSFKNENLLEEDDAIRFIDSITGMGASSYCKILELIDSHRKVLYMYDGDSADNCSFYHRFAKDVTYGSVDFWIYGHDVTKTLYILFRDDTTDRFGVRIYNDTVEYWNGSFTATGSVPTDFTWHHFCIGWELTAGGYQQLAQYRWHVYIDGVHRGDYTMNGSPTEITNVWFYTADAETSEWYLDAFGSQWRADYALGDNNYWKNYHDTWFETEDSYKRNTDLVFVDDTSGQDSGCYSDIIPFFDNHSKVLRLYDGNGSGDAVVMHDVSPVVSYGTIEFYMRCDGTFSATPLLFAVRDGGTELFRVRMRDDAGTDKIEVNTGAGYVALTTTAVNQTWYHLKFHFECTTGGYKGLSQYYFKVYLDGVDKGSHTFTSNQPHLDEFYIVTGNAYTGASYISSLRCSWDIGWVEGDSQTLVVKEPTYLTTIFDGLIEDYDFFDEKNINAVARSDELQTREVSGARMAGYGGQLISSLLDVFASHVFLDYPTVTLDTKKANWSFEEDSLSKVNEQLSWVDEWDTDESPYESYGSISYGSSTPDDVHIFHKHSLITTGKYGSAKHNLDHTRETGCISFWCKSKDGAGFKSDFYVRLITPRERIMGYIRIDAVSAASATLYIGNVDGGGEHSVLAGMAHNTWYRIEYKWRSQDGPAYEGLSANQHRVIIYNSSGTQLAAYTDTMGYSTEHWGASQIEIRVVGTLGTSPPGYWRVGAINFDWVSPFGISDNADYETYKQIFIGSFRSLGYLEGDISLYSFIDTICKDNLRLWYLTPVHSLRAVTVSGLINSNATLPTTESGDIWNVKGSVQVKRVNRVVLVGPTGLRSIKEDTSRQTSDVGVVVYSDMVGFYGTQDELDSMAQNILDGIKNPPISWSCECYNPDFEYIQPGEYVTVTANSIRFDNSKLFVPANTYVVKQIRTIYESGSYVSTKMKLMDGLNWNLPARKEEHRSESVYRSERGHGYRGQRGV